MTDSVNPFVMALPSFASRESYQNSDVKLGGRDWWAFDTTPLAEWGAFRERRTLDVLERDYANPTPERVVPDSSACRFSAISKKAPRIHT